MAETRGKNKNLIEAGNPRLLKKEVKAVQSTAFIWSIS